VEYETLTSVTRLTDMSSDDLLVGTLFSPRPGTPRNKAPDDFTDENTLVADQSHEVMLGLSSRIEPAPCLA
jgi:hypothetical protein